jgi:hypothetical protein
MLERQVQDVIFETKAGDIYTNSRGYHMGGAVHVRGQVLP